MKNKILDILDKVSNLPLEELFYSLTINYSNVVINSIFDVDKAKNILNEYTDEIDSYNLSFSNHIGYDESKYMKYYHNFEFIFHEGDEDEIFSSGNYLYFFSNYINTQYAHIRIHEFGNLMNVLNEYIQASKTLYKTINIISGMNDYDKIMSYDEILQYINKDSDKYQTQELDILLESIKNMQDITLRDMIYMLSKIQY